MVFEFKAQDPGALPRRGKAALKSPCTFIAFQGGFVVSCGIRPQW